MTRAGPLERLYVFVMQMLKRAVDFNLFHVNRRPHVPARAIPDAIRGTFDFRVFSGAAVTDCPTSDAMELNRPFIEAAAARGDCCAAVLDRDGAVVAYDWRAFEGPTPIDDTLAVEFSHPGQVYGYKMFTDSRHRGQRLQLFSLWHFEEWLLGLGFTHTIGYVATQNLASRRALAKAEGQQTVGFAGYFRLFGRYFTFRTPGARRYGFRIRVSPASV
jgi:hypothetical protein